MIDTKILYKIYELKGMINSLNSSAKMHDKYNYPLIKEINDTIENITKMVNVQENRKGDLIFPGHFAITKNFIKSKGFHSKSNA